MTFEDLQAIISDIRCSVGGTDWTIHAGIMGGGFYIQLRYIEQDIGTGNPQDQHGRKWYVSSHSVKSEVVQTVLKAALTSAEHQCREHFTYRGVQIFSPHLSVDKLVEMASGKDAISARGFEP